DFLMINVMRKNELWNNLAEKRERIEELVKN
ncbi:unnamed protein product, partial [marine sediment metagenome]